MKDRLLAPPFSGNEKMAIDTLFASAKMPSKKAEEGGKHNRGNIVSLQVRVLWKRGSDGQGHLIIRLKGRGNIEMRKKHPLSIIILL